MKTVLIVDDQQGIRLLLDEVFRKGGYETEGAENGLEALQKIERQEPDCILLDMKMPGMTGIEVLAEIQAKWAHIPVIMMTAYGELETTQRALNLGAKRYLTKPFDIFEVREAVDGLFVSR